MTRQAVETGFERFVTEAMTATAASFRVTAALDGMSGGGGSGVVDQLVQNSDAIQNHVVDPKLDEYRADILLQFDAVLDYAESDSDIAAFREAILAHDAYKQALRPGLSTERRSEIEDRLVDREQGLGDAVVPLIDAPEDEFWPALQSTYSQADAEAIVDTQFRFTGPIQDYPDAFEFATEIDPGELLDGLGGLLGGGLPTIRVSFTDEARRAMGRGEETVVRDTTRELRRRYESTG
jgi:hypothetical protein